MHNNISLLYHDPDFKDKLLLPRLVSMVFIGGLLLMIVSYLLFVSSTSPMIWYTLVFVGIIFGGFLLATGLTSRNLQYSVSLDELAHYLIIDLHRSTPLGQTHNPTYINLHDIKKITIDTLNNTPVLQLHLSDTEIISILCGNSDNAGKIRQEIRRVLALDTEPDANRMAYYEASFEHQIVSLMDATTA